jgi:hypothetical protein
LAIGFNQLLEHATAKLREQDLGRGFFSSSTAPTDSATRTNSGSSCGHGGIAR